MMIQSLTIVAAALTGGLAGAAFTFIANWMRGRWLRPQIKVLFNNKEPGCLMKTSPAPGAPSDACYVRLKIKNKGRSTARGVSVCTTSVTFTEQGGGSHTYNEDVLDLILANGRHSPFMLAPHAHRYIDLAIIEDIRNQFYHRYIVKGDPPARFKDKSFGFGQINGNFKAVVFASSDNTEATENLVEWKWDGRSLGGVEIVGIMDLR
jgi:hypothetical protein